MPKRDTPTATVTKLGNPFTGSWKDANGNEIPKGATVRTADGSLTGKVISRWTNVKDGVRIPFVSVEPAMDSAGVAAVLGGRPRKTFGIAASDLLVESAVAKPKPARKPRAKKAEAPSPELAMAG